MIIIQNLPIPIPVPKCWGRNARNNSMHHSLLSVLAMDQHHITTHTHNTRWANSLSRDRII